ncbi:MAG: sugar ABC transporter permease [Ilumatobacteraceae bacterium]
MLGGFYWLTNFLPTKRQEAGRAWVFAFPAVFLLSVGLLVPAVRTIYLSFFDDNMKGFVGLDNYKTIATTQGTRLTVFNSLAWVIVGTIVTCIVGLAIARFADGMRGEKIAKSLIFLPGAISLVGAGVVWKFVYADNSQLGLLNQVTKVIPGLPNSLGGNGRATGCSSGIGGIDPPGSLPGFNTMLLIVIFIWAQAGFATVVFSAAIKGVPDSLIEAAKVDGATAKQAFYKVTLPYIEPRS